MTIWSNYLSASHPSRADKAADSGPPLAIECIGAGRQGNTGQAGAINRPAAPRRMLLYSRPFHPDCDGSRHPHSDCDGSRRMPILGECSPDWQGPVVALPQLLPPLPGPRRPSTPQRTWKYWPRANPSADAIEFRAQMQLTPAKEAHFRNTRRPSLMACIRAFLGSIFARVCGTWRRPCGVAIHTLVDLNTLAGKSQSL